MRFNIFSMCALVIWNCTFPKCPFMSSIHCPWGFILLFVHKSSLHIKNINLFWQLLPDPPWGKQSNQHFPQFGPPGSPVPGILQARALEWVAISFSNAWKWKVKVKLLSRVRLLATPWTAAHQAPPSMGFSRQEYWSGVPLPSPGEALRVGISNTLPGEANAVDL